jgi:hypothetical protein
MEWIDNGDSRTKQCLYLSSNNIDLLLKYFGPLEMHDVNPDLSHLEFMNYNGFYAVI